MQATKEKRTEVDEDLAVKPCPPAVDAGLGIFFALLCGKGCLHYINDLELGKMYACSLLVVVVAIRLVRGFARIAGRWVSANLRNGAHIPEDCRHPLRKRLQLRKFTDQAWQLAIHVSMAWWEWRLIRPEWWAAPGTTFLPCPKDPALEHAFEMKLFYCVQIAIWTWTGFSCKYLEERRKDYVEMMLHHCVTIALMLFSQINNQHAIGLVVVFCHDLSDVFLDLMKMSNYLKIEDRHGLFCTEILFFINTYCSWTYLRLYVFPVYVIYYGSFLGYFGGCVDYGEGLLAERVPDVAQRLALNWNDGLGIGPSTVFNTHIFTDSADGRKAARAQEPFWLEANILLSVLLVLHVFWFYLLNRIAFKMLRGQSGSHAGKAVYEGHSDSEGDEHGKHGIAKKKRK